MSTEEEIQTEPPNPEKDAVVKILRPDTLDVEEATYTVQANSPLKDIKDALEDVYGKGLLLRDDMRKNDLIISKLVPAGSYKYFRKSVPPLPPPSTTTTTAAATGTTKGKRKVNDEGGAAGDSFKRVKTEVRPLISLTDHMLGEKWQSVTFAVKCLYELEGNDFSKFWAEKGPSLKAIDHTLTYCRQELAPFTFYSDAADLMKMVDMTILPPQAGLIAMCFTNQQAGTDAHKVRMDVCYCGYHHGQLQPAHMFAKMISGLEFKPNLIDLLEVIGQLISRGGHGLRAQNLFTLTFACGATNNYQYIPLLITTSLDPSQHRVLYSNVNLHLSNDTTAIQMASTSATPTAEAEAVGPEAGTGSNTPVLEVGGGDITPGSGTNKGKGSKKPKPEPVKIKVDTATQAFKELCWQMWRSRKEWVLRAAADLGSVCFKDGERVRVLSETGEQAYTILQRLSAPKVSGCVYRVQPAGTPDIEVVLKVNAPPDLLSWANALCLDLGDWKQANNEEHMLETLSEHGYAAATSTLQYGSVKSCIKTAMEGAQVVVTAKVNRQTEQSSPLAGAALLAGQ